MRALAGSLLAAVADSVTALGAASALPELWQEADDLRKPRLGSSKVFGGSMCALSAFAIRRPLTLQRVALHFAPNVGTPSDPAAVSNECYFWVTT